MGHDNCPSRCGFFNRPQLPATVECSREPSISNDPTHGFRIIQFLERCSGTFDLYGEIANVDAFIRYCFEHEADAEAFHVHFAPAAEKAIFKKAT